MFSQKVTAFLGMVDVFLIIVCIVFSVLSFVVGFFIITMFQNKEDRFGPCYSWFCKIIAILAFGCAAMNVLCLPLDALNRSSQNTLQIDLMCWVFLIVSAVLCFAVLPFSISLYENKDEEDHKCPVCCAFLTVIPFLLFVVIFFLILWFAVGRCEIPVLVQTSDMSENEGILIAACDTCVQSEETWNITPSAIVYAISLIGFLGYILFLIEGGCGMVTLPFGLIRTWVNRPRPIDPAVYAHARTKINQWSNELLDRGNVLKDDVLKYGRNHRKVRKQYAQFQQQVEALEKTYETVEVSYRVRGGNPVWPWILFILGLICIVLSLVWIIHVIFYYVLGMHPILNSFFVLMDNAFPYGAVIFYGIFVYYLFWAVVDGTTTVGINLLFIRVHEMEKGNTPMTSILFNGELLIFASFGVALFASMNFNLYTRLSSLDMIYGTQMQNIAGLKYVWKYGVYVWFGFIVIGLIWQLITLRKRNKKIDIIKECFKKHDVDGIGKGKKKGKKGKDSSSDSGELAERKGEANL